MQEFETDFQGAVKYLQRDVAEARAQARAAQAATGLLLRYFLQGTENADEVIDNFETVLKGISFSSEDEQSDYLEAMQIGLAKGFTNVMQAARGRDGRKETE